MSDIETEREKYEAFMARVRSPEVQRLLDQAEEEMNQHIWRMLLLEPPKKYERKAVKALIAELELDN